MKISLITTVLNEEKTIEEFLDSVAAQKQLPDEVVIVDGGSKDETKKKILGKGKKIKLFVVEGANRSEGRNEAIKRAENEIIAVTDVGCVLDKNWLLEIAKPFLDPKVKVVAGYYLPEAKTVFQKCVAPFFCVMPDFIEKHKNKADFEFLPSSRSVAFRKEVWEKTGGYPSKLNYCEDLVFDQKIKRAGFKIYFNPEAIVFWPQRSNLMAVFKQFFHYAVGDGQVFFSRYQTHSRKIAFIYLRYLLALLLLIFGFKDVLFWKILLAGFWLYILREILEKYRYVKQPAGVIVLPIVRFAADIAVMAGTLIGLRKGVMG